MMTALFGGFLVTLGVARASEDISKWIPMPSGLAYHEACIHQYTKPFVARRLPGGNTEINDKILQPCPHSPRKLTDTTSYYSDWSVYAQTTVEEVEVDNNKEKLGAGADADFTFFSAEWVVPQPPSSSGPVGLSSVYFFNGLEDGGGKHGNASLILQPVLQYGKSGCVLNPAKWHAWHLVAYLVDGNGRAHCGPIIEVQPGQRVVGTMQQTPAGSNNWDITATAMPVSGDLNQTSTYSASLGDKVIDAAYLTLEGMVIYNCGAYPPGGGTRFSNISIAIGGENLYTPIDRISWTPKIRHTECSQAVTIDAPNGDVVTLRYTDHAAVTNV